MRPCRLILLMAVFYAPTIQAQNFDFSWDHATVYRVVTDRFSNGDSSNDFAYGRGLDGNGSPYDKDPSGHFDGGDFAGLISWMDDDYFSSLGINALWISAPYEQVHGWIGGGDGDVQQYGYDGSWPLDYTSLDNAYGNEADFAALFVAAREKGMKVIIDVDLNHVGPATMHDMAAFNFGGLNGDSWRSWTPSSRVGWQSYLSDQVALEDSVSGWERWWGTEWIRADVAGYEGCGADDQTMCVRGLPDLRSDIEVSSLPTFLALKWGSERTAVEQQELDDFFQRNGAQRTATNHVVKWLADWARDWPIDGFYVREAGNIDPAAMTLLAQEVARARAGKMAASGEDEWSADQPFLLLTDGMHSSPSQVEGVTYRHMAQHRPNSSSDALSEAVQASTEIVALATEAPPFRTVSSPSEGRITRSSFQEHASSFLLSAGPLVIYYGDENGQESGPEVSDSRLAAMAPMDWDGADEDLVDVFRRLSLFRGSHPAIACGGYDMVQESPMAFHRGVQIGMDTDQVVILDKALGKTRVNVSIVWPDDTVLRDAMTGSISIVSYGQVSFTAHPSGLMLLEEVRD
ncbi:MAG: alpha-amylase family glycosyl hydrolase [Bacteroidetes bacterium]|nr:alpha-amylase family glycosyl hydrolase [Bacteroidota bacterium]